MLLWPGPGSGASLIPPYCSALQAPTLCFTLGPEQSPTPPATGISSPCRQHNLMLHTSLRQFLENSKECSLELVPLQQTIHHLWRKLRKRIMHFLQVPDESIKIKCSFTSDLFETLYLHVWFQWSCVFYAPFLPRLGYTWWTNEEEGMSYCFSLKCIIQNSCRRF